LPRPSARPIDPADDVAADLADQHHAGHVEGLGVGDPEAVPEPGLLAEASEEVADLGTTAVDDDRPQPDGAQQHDVGGEGRQDVVVDDGVAPELDDDDRPPEALQVGQGLQQGRGPQLR
jgi:hypothetical protein